MKKQFLFILLVCLLSTSINALDINVKPGWQLKGTDSDFSDIEVFNKDCIHTVWAYDDVKQKWKAYSPESYIMGIINSSSSIDTLTGINPSDGFWIKGNDICTINETLPLETEFTQDDLLAKTFYLVIPLQALSYGYETFEFSQTYGEVYISNQYTSNAYTHYEIDSEGKLSFTENMITVKIVSRNKFYFDINTSQTINGESFSIEGRMYFTKEDVDAYIIGLEPEQTHIYDGTWTGTATSSTAGCSDSTLNISISSSVMTGDVHNSYYGQLTANATISDTGEIVNGTFSVGSIVGVTFTGQASSNISASGTWYATDGCSGTFSLTK